MTDDQTTDAELRTLLLAEVPAPGPGYWNVIDELVNDAGASGESQPTLAPVTHVAHDVTDISTKQRTEIDEAHPSFFRRLGWPAAVAASLLLVVGLIALVGSRRSANNNDLATGPAAGDTREPASDVVGPKQNLDHWHAVYGVWDCTQSDSAGAWLPHFSSQQDNSGIHSHNDGVIHIHPFFDWSAGENAQLGLFTTEMQVELSDDLLVLDDGRRLVSGEASCDGEPAVLHVRHWDYDFEALAGEEPEIITEDLAGARFINDREAWAIVYAPLNAELPQLPQERFDTLNNVTAPQLYVAPPG